MSDFNTIADKIEEHFQIMEELKKMRGSKNSYPEGTAEEVFKRIFAKIPDIQAIACKGWTPGFNDGEPCEHMDYMVFSGGDAINENFSDWAVNSFFAEEWDGGKEKPLELNPPNANRIWEEAFNGKYNDIFEFFWNTNFQVVVKRKGDSVEIDDVEYYCGY